MASGSCFRDVSEDELSLLPQKAILEGTKTARKCSIKIFQSKNLLKKVLLMCCDGNEQYKSFTQHASAAKF